MSDFSGEVDNSAMPIHSKRLGREFAMEFLFSCDLQEEIPGVAKFEQFLETARDEFQMKDNRLSRRAEEYARKLYECVTLEKEEIDGIISRYCENWAWERLSHVDRNIMRVAVAEMRSFPDVPVIVSIDEAVEIARDFSGVEAGNFINGVLNAIKNCEFAAADKK